MEIRPILSTLMRSKTAPLLVAMQVAISLAILANSLYVVSQRQTSSARPSGLAAEADVMYMSLRPVGKQTHNELIAQQKADVAAIAAIPGVISAAWVNQMPMSRSGSSSGFAIDRKQERATAELATYFSPDSLIDTLGLKLVDGRDFTPDEIIEFDPDVEEFSPKTVIITKAVADLFYPGASAVGKTLFFGVQDEAQPLRVVGVVERLQTPSAQTGPDAELSVIMPMRPSQPSQRIAARVEPGQRDRVTAEAETALRNATPVPRVIRGRTVENDRYERYRNERSFAWMLITVSIVLLLVTASGIVGMTVLRVAQRRKQIGIRRALGARRGDIVRYFLTENLLITSVGVVGGVVLAVVLNHTLMAQVELARLPVGYLVAGMVTLWVLGLLAVCGPAWRAAGIPPATATRSV